MRSDFYLHKFEMASDLSFTLNSYTAQLYPQFSVQISRIKFHRNQLISLGDEMCGRWSYRQDMHTLHSTYGLNANSKVET
jgi:hypothetical protein